MSKITKTKFTIGILLPPNVHVHKWDEYGLIILNCLIRYSTRYNFVILYFDKEILNWLSIPDKTVTFVQVERRTGFQRINGMINLILGSKLLPMASNEQSRKLKEADIDLLIHPFPGLFGYLNHIPYIVAITNLMYKYYSDTRELAERREFLGNITVRNAAKHSVLTVVDSRQGENDLFKYFGILKDHMRIIPHIPPSYIYANRDMNGETIKEVLAKYDLPEKYVFYPAQFWRHKNHLRLIRSLRTINEKFDTKIHLVMTGHPYESYTDVMALIKQLHMNDQVIHLGYVTDVEIVALYKKAVALVYPSLYGPTNIPPVEAMILGVPVLCSNIFLMPEQVGDAGLLFDPFSIEAMAEKIYQIWTDAVLRGRLVQKGYERIKDMTRENYAKQWEAAIEDALQRLNNSTLKLTRPSNIKSAGVA
jgi:glycosyltransferase involved in cell wall biosynthesis